MMSRPKRRGPAATEATATTLGESRMSRAMTTGATIQGDAPVGRRRVNEHRGRSIDQE
jgi:hypothetical protein